VDGAGVMFAQVGTECRAPTVVPKEVPHLRRWGISFLRQPSPSGLG